MVVYAYVHIQLYKKLPNISPKFLHSFTSNDLDFYCSDYQSLVFPVLDCSSYYNKIIETR
jgi:hypothetical protein